MAARPAGAASAGQGALEPPPAFVVALAQRSARLGDPQPDSATNYLARRELAVEASSGGSVNSKTPVCAAADLRGRAAFQGATGSRLGGLTVTNSASVACSLPSKPRISLVSNGRRLAVREVAFPPHWLERMNPKWATPVRTLQPGQSVEVVLQWWNWCGPPHTGTSTIKVSVDLLLPNQPAALQTAVAEPVTPPYCNGPPSTLRVSPFVST